MTDLQALAFNCASEAWLRIMKRLERETHLPKTNHQPRRVRGLLYCDSAFKKTSLMEQYIERI